MSFVATDFVFFPCSLARYADFPKSAPGIPDSAAVAIANTRTIPIIATVAVFTLSMGWFSLFFTINSLYLLYVQQYL